MYWALEAMLLCIAVGVVVRLGVAEEGKQLIGCPARVSYSFGPVVVISSRGTDPCSIISGTGAREQSAGVVGYLPIVQLRLGRSLVVDDQMCLRKLGSGQRVGD